MLQIEARKDQRLSNVHFPAKTWTSSYAKTDSVIRDRAQGLQSWLQKIVSRHGNSIALASFLEDDGSENSLVDLLVRRPGLALPRCINCKR
jgi:hypothetical protein